MAPKFDNPTIPPDSLVLVTGANGLVGSHVVDQFLAAGYRVRGTVRSTTKSGWLQKFFNDRYTSGRFELAEVPDLNASNAYDQAIKDVAAVAHTASPADLTIVKEEAIEQGVDAAINCLEAAKKESSVKAFVLTGSEWSIYSPDPKRQFHVDESTWNEEAVELLKNKDLPDSYRGILTYTATKVRTEQACWKWINQESPAFTFSTVLPGTVFGRVLNPEAQGIPSTTGFVKLAFYGENIEFLKMVAPQWFIDVQDNAKLHVAAVMDPSTNGERIFGFSERFSWNKVAEIFNELYPKHKLTEFEDFGWDQCHIPERIHQRGAKLLQKFGQDGWTSLHDSVKANVESFIADN